MSETIKLVLGKSDFKALVNGDVLEIEDDDGQIVEILLSDIGFQRMLDLINEAWDKVEDED